MLWFPLHPRPTPSIHAAHLLQSACCTGQSGLFPGQVLIPELLAHPPSPLPSSSRSHPRSHIPSWLQSPGQSSSVFGAAWSSGLAQWSPQTPSRLGRTALHRTSPWCSDEHWGHLGPSEKWSCGSCGCLCTCWTDGSPSEVSPDPSGRLMHLLCRSLLGQRLLLEACMSRCERHSCFWR